MARLTHSVLYKPMYSNTKTKHRYVKSFHPPLSLYSPPLRRFLSLEEAFLKIEGNLSQGAEEEEEGSKVSLHLPASFPLQFREYRRRNDIIHAAQTNEAKGEKKREKREREKTECKFHPFSFLPLVDPNNWIRRTVIRRWEGANVASTGWEKGWREEREPRVEYKFEYRCPLNPIEGFGRSLLSRSKGLRFEYSRKGYITRRGMSF